MPSAKYLLSQPPTAVANHWRAVFQSTHWAHSQHLKRKNNKICCHNACTLKTWNFTVKFTFRILLSTITSNKQNLLKLNLYSDDRKWIDEPQACCFSCWCNFPMKTFHESMLSNASFWNTISNKFIARILYKKCYLVERIKRFCIGIWTIIWHISSNFVPFVFSISV